MVSLFVGSEFTAVKATMTISHEIVNRLLENYPVSFCYHFIKKDTRPFIP